MKPRTLWIAMSFAQAAFVVTGVATALFGLACLAEGVACCLQSERDK